MKTKIFLKESSSSLDPPVETFVREVKSALTKNYDLENRDNSTPITHFCFSDYQNFESNIKANDYLNDSSFKSIKNLCGTLTEEIRRPLTGNVDYEQGVDSKNFAILGVSEVSGF